MSILDTTIVNVALATLGRDLHSTISQIQWVVTGYMLALAAVIPLSGWAAERFGPRRMYLISLVLFTAGSMLCGISTSTTELIIFRVVQGVGGGMLMPLGMMMMAGAAGPKRMGRVMSIVSMPMMLAPILGPTLFGGMILLPLYWQHIRGESVLDAGLLMAPQGLGMALVMPAAGRLTDRIGGGPLAVVGVTVTTLATIPFGMIGAHTSIT